jgi:hypothetical protein
MTVETTPNAPNYAIMDTEALVEAYAITTDALVVTRETQLAMEYEIISRMQDDGATILDHPSYNVTLAVKTEYIREELHPLRELVSPEIVAKGFNAEHEETVMIQERWDMRQVLTWRKYGQKAKDIIEAASRPGKVKLSVEAKESSA